MVYDWFNSKTKAKGTSIFGSLKVGKIKKISSISKFRNKVSPLNIFNSKRIKNIPKKNLTWAQAKIKYPKTNPFGDSDKDGTKNWMDCKPFNKFKQDDDDYNPIDDNWDENDGNVNYGNYAKLYRGETDDEPEPQRPMKIQRRKSIIEKLKEEKEAFKPKKEDEEDINDNELEIKEEPKEESKQALPKKIKSRGYELPKPPKPVPPYEAKFADAYCSTCGKVFPREVGATSTHLCDNCWTASRTPKKEVEKLKIVPEGLAIQRATREEFELKHAMAFGDSSPHYQKYRNQINRGRKK